MTPASPRRRLLIAVVGLLATVLVPDPSRAQPTDRAAPLIAAVPEEDWPPYYAATGEALTGINVDVARLLLERMGRRVEFRRMPYARVLSSIQHGTVDMLIDFVGTDPKLHVVDEPILHVPIWLVLPRARSDQPFQSLDDFRKSPIAVVRGYTYGESFDGDKGIRRMEVPNELAVIRAAAERDMPGLAYAGADDPEYRASGLLPLVSFRPSPLPPPELRFAFARIPGHADLARELGERLAALRKTPEFTAILRQHGRTAPP